MIAVVTTTIHVPKLLTSYVDNAKRFGHTDVEIIVVGDKKTPQEAQSFCRSLSSQLPTHFIDVDAQHRLLEPWPALRGHLPYNCIQRRNVGLLLAYARGAEAIVTIDDDNFNAGQDFIGAHRQVGVDRELPTVSSTSGWYNVCAHLSTDDDVPFYHRGFPWNERWREQDSFVSSATQRRRCVVNAGFWLDDPDIDALARMHRQPVVRGLKAGSPSQLTLASETFSPFNSQNTSLWREVIPAYFLTPFAGRYDDIWASYIIMRIAAHLGDSIAFGEPWVRQARNPHDLWRDLDQERAGMQLTPGFVSALRQIKLTQKTYHGCLGELCAALPSTWQLEERQASSFASVKEDMLVGLRLWHEVFSDTQALSQLGQAQL